MPELLIELFSEEMPARMQSRAAEDLHRLVTEGLREAGLTFDAAQAFSTPRRLTLVVPGLLAESPATREERKGPKVGAPEKALAGFLRSTGLTQDQLKARETGKGEVWFAILDRPGRPAAEIIAEVLEKTIRAFPWPKSMRWGDGTLRWVRPLRSILCILSEAGQAKVVPLRVDHLSAGNTTEGHRFIAPDRFAVTSFEHYAAELAARHVVLDAAARAHQIWQDATELAQTAGLELVDDPALLREVAGLVEWPVVLMGEIGTDFLDLPPEVLQTSMREHQKFFSVRQPATGRIERFVTVANIDAADGGATILSGNQKVLAARLSDAKFFWENDLRVAREAHMQPWLDQLAAVTFHAKLGSVAEQIGRIAELAREIAPRVEAEPDHAAEAARLAKADLASEMVYEFPELQGVMGRYYGEAAGVPAEIAAAAADHYAPLGPSDDVPSGPVSVAVALADKVDKLVGFWAINEKPSGRGDPYALRRAALGVIRLVLSGHRIALLALFERANAIAGPRDGHTAEAQDLLSFIHDRLKVYLRDQGLRHDVIDAVLALPDNDDLVLLVARAQAVAAFLDTEDGANLVQGFKRANNILSQAEAADGVEYSYGPDAKLADDPAEVALFAALDQAEARLGPAMAEEDFAAAMTQMAALRAPIDAFFEAVQINTDSQIIRRNRLNLLHRIRATCSKVADLTRLDG